MGDCVKNVNVNALLKDDPLNKFYIAQNQRDGALPGAGLKASESYFLRTPK